MTIAVTIDGAAADVDAWGPGASWAADHVADLLGAGDATLDDFRPQPGIALVSYALAGEPRGTEDRMLDLLEPYAGHRARVIRLIERSGIGAPRYGPRVAVPAIASL